MAEQVRVKQQENAQMLTIIVSISNTMASKLSGGFLALQAKKSKAKKKTTDLEDAFRSADRDGDGRLSLNEWVEVLKSTGHSMTR